MYHTFWNLLASRESVVRNSVNVIKDWINELGFLQISTIDSYSLESGLDENSSSLSGEGIIFKKTYHHLRPILPANTLIHYNINYLAAIYYVKNDMKEKSLLKKKINMMQEYLRLNWWKDNHSPINRIKPTSFRRVQLTLERKRLHCSPRVIYLYSHRRVRSVMLAGLGSGNKLVTS